MWFFFFLCSILKLPVNQLQFTRHATKPLGAMVSSPDQTPQVPVMLIIIIHYIERPAPSVRLVKAIHLRAYRNIVLSVNCNTHQDQRKFLALYCIFYYTSIVFFIKGKIYESKSFINT